MEQLETRIRELFDQFAPVKIFKVKQNKINWLTEDLRGKIEARNRMRRRLEDRGGSEADWRTWKTLRNKVNKELKQAKKNYLKMNLQRKMSNSKCLWDGVKSFLGWSTGGSPEMVVNGKGETLLNPRDVAEEIQLSFQGKLREVEESLG